MSTEESVNEKANNSENLDDTTETNAEVVEEQADLSKDLAVAQEEAEKYKKEYLYLRAEFDNYRKRMMEERSNTLKYGAEAVIRELLGVLDNFDLALKTQLNQDTMSSFQQGVQMIRSEFFSVMERNGVSELPAEGLDFDPAVHEALSNEETDKVAPGKVATVFKRAYKLHDKLIRPAQVTVAKEKSDAN